MPQKKKQIIRATPGNPLPVPNLGYEYGDTPLKYVIVDLNKMYVCPLWHSSRGRIANYIKTAKEVTDENHSKYNQVSPYAGLKAIANGTFVFNSAKSAGHLVGYERSDSMFDSKDSFYWAWDASALWDPRKRWGLAIDNRGDDGVDPLIIRTEKGGSLLPDYTPPTHATFEDLLEDKYMMLIHGGYLLFKPGVFPESELDLPELPPQPPPSPPPPTPIQTYKRKFNLINTDRFDGVNAYVGIKGPLTRGRWGIGLISGTSKIVIFSTINPMTVYDFAKTIRDNTFGGNDIEEAMIFDGGSAHAFQAVTDIKYNINDANISGQPPRVDRQHHNQVQASNSQFAVFKIHNVAFTSIADRKVPVNYGVDDTVMPILVDKSTNSLKFKFKVAKSAFYRKTHKVEFFFVSRYRYDLQVWSPTQQIVKTLNRPQLVFNAEKDIELVNVDSGGSTINEKNKVLAMSVDGDKGVVCIIRAFDKNDEEISRQAVTVKFYTGIRYGLLLDKSEETASADVQKARNTAALMITHRALAKAKIPIAGATTISGFPTELCIIGFSSSDHLLSDWTAYENQLETAIGNLYSATGSDFYNGFSMLKHQFQKIAVTDGPHYYRAFFFAASKHQSHLHNFNRVMRELAWFKTANIPIHCIGCCNADIPGELDRIAQATGGHVYSTGSIGDLVDRFTKAYTEDQNEVYVKNLKEPLTPGGVVQTTATLNTRELTTFQVHWEDAVAPNIVIKRPDGRAISAGNSDVDVITGNGFAIYLVRNPRKDIHGTSYNWQIKVTGRRPEEASQAVNEAEGDQDEVGLDRQNQVFITVTHDKGEIYVDNEILLQHESIPGNISTGEDLLVEIYSHPLYAMPESIALFMRHVSESGYTEHYLNRLTEERWQVSIPASTLLPGRYFSYFVAETNELTYRFPEDSEYITEAAGTEIVFENPLIPKTVRQGENMAVSVSTGSYSLQPDVVVLHIRYQDQNQFQEYVFSEDPVTGTWNTTVPGEFLNRTGNVISYIEGRRGETVAYAPDGAPDAGFRTLVKTIPARYLPWVFEYADQSYGDEFYKVRLSLRNDDGSEKLSVGHFIVSSLHWFGQHYAIDRSAMITDPFDHGVWVFSAGTASPSPRDLRLQKILPDGNVDRTIPVSELMRHIVLDPVRDRMWGISAANTKKIMTIDLETGQENHYTQDKMLLCLAADQENGDIFAGGNDYIYKMNKQAILQPFNSEVRGCWKLNILPGGELLAKAAVQVPNTPPHNTELTLLWLNNDGTIKHQVESYGMGYEILAQDVVSNDVWVLDGINRPCHIIRYNANLQGELSVSNLRHFDSISLDYFTGGIWVTGEDWQGEGFWGRINPEGEMEKIGNLKAPALVSQFREPAKNLQEGYVPEIAFEGFDMAVSASTTKRFTPPVKVMFKTTGSRNKSYALKREDDGSWRGSIPGDDLEPGTLESYITSQGGHSAAMLPRGAPETRFKTEIQPSLPLWVCEHKGAGFNKNYLKAQVRYLNAIGEEEFSADSFSVPAEPRQYVLFAPAALTVDALDGSAWVFDARQANKFRLVNIRPDGTKREVKVSRHFTFCAVDSSRKVIWGGSHMSGGKLVAINRDTGAELASWNFEAWSLALDPSTGDCLAWGWGSDQRRGIFRFRVDSSPSLVRLDGSPCRELQVLPDGRFVCIHDYFQNATRIVLFDAQGNVLQHSKKQSGFSLTSAQGLIFDPVMNRAWIIPVKRGIFTYNFNEQEFKALPARYANFRRFQFHEPNCIALNPESGGMWVTARASSSTTVLVYFDSTGRVMRLAEIGGTAMVRSIARS